MIHARKKDLVSQLRTMLLGKEGIERIYGTEEIAKIGIPLSSQSGQAPDMVLSAAPGYLFSNEPEGNYVTPPDEGGTHGYINDDPEMQAIFIAWEQIFQKVFAWTRFRTSILPQRSLCCSDLR